MKCQALIHKLDSLKMCCLLIPDATLIALNNNESKGRYNQRVLVTVNDTITWQGGIVVYGEGFGYVTFSKARMKQLNVLEGDTVSVELQKDTSEFGHEFPEELEIVLAQDPEAKKRFADLTPGKQRTIIYYILQAKGSDKRIERSVLYMRNLVLCPLGKETMPMIMKKA